MTTLHGPNWTIFDLGEHPKRAEAPVDQEAVRKQFDEYRVAIRSYLESMRLKGAHPDILAHAALDVAVTWHAETHPAADVTHVMAEVISAWGEARGERVDFSALRIPLGEEPGRGEDA
jgi:hypothetical protein